MCIKAFYDEARDWDAHDHGLFSIVVVDCNYKLTRLSEVKYYHYYFVWGPSTKDVRQMGRGGGFDISDISGRGEGGWFVKVRTSENF